MSKHGNHSEYCPIICSLEKLETEKRVANEICSIDAETLPYKMKMKLIRLVGERPVVDIFLDGVGVKGLWDTGAMVSVINEDFLRDHFPSSVIRPVEEITGKKDFSITVANQGCMKVKGIAILDFVVDRSQKLFKIPFLVTEDNLANTIIGYNTIEHLVTNFADEIDLPVSLTTVFGTSLKNAENMVNLVQMGGEIDQLAQEAKLDKTSVIYPGCVEKVRCKIRNLQVSNVFNKVILFQPLEEFCLESELIVFDSPHVIKNQRKFVDVTVYNPTSQKIVISKSTVLGQISDVAAAFTLPVIPNSGQVNEIGTESEKGNLEVTHDLEHLSPEQKEIVAKMLYEEREVFS